MKIPSAQAPAYVRRFASNLRCGHITERSGDPVPAYFRVERDSRVLLNVQAFDRISGLMTEVFKRSGHIVFDR